MNYLSTGDCAIGETRTVIGQNSEGGLLEALALESLSL
jgi:hypothetical protein